MASTRCSAATSAGLLTREGPRRRRSKGVCRSPWGTTSNVSKKVLANLGVQLNALPGKAIALLDEAASQVSVQYSLAPPDLKEAWEGLEAVLHAKKDAIQSQEYILAAELRDREVKLRDRIAKLEVSWHKTRDPERPVVVEKAIVQIISAEL